MNRYRIEDYTFAGLRRSGSPSLAYLVGLADSPAHKIAEPRLATNIMSYLYDIEEQCRSGKELLESQEQYFRRFFSGGYIPQTPVMLTDRWSPIGAMLERGLEPLTLKRDIRANAAGIWPAVSLEYDLAIPSCATPEELFWGVMAKVSARAVEHGMLISVVAKPGWAYDNPGCLPPWPAKEIAIVDRVLWHRVPKGLGVEKSY